MTDLRKAAEQALEIFDWLERRSMYQDLQMKKTHEALRQALAQPVDNVYISEERVHKTEKSIHEPVAWMKSSGLISPYKHGSYQIPLYTAPPKKEWVGLTDDEKYDVLEGATGDGGRVYYDTLFRSYEAKLKEKNV